MSQTTDLDVRDRLARVEQSVEDLRDDVGELKADTKKLLAAVHAAGGGGAALLRLGGLVAVCLAAAGWVWDHFLGHRG